MQFGDFTRRESTFKIITTLAYMRQHPNDYQNFVFNCEGLVTRDDVSITCYGGSVHGMEDLETAFKNSCNGAFATIGTELDNAEFKKICESFGFNKDLSINMASADSRFTLAEDASCGEEMTTAIGQGDTWQRRFRWLWWPQLWQMAELS